VDRAVVGKTVGILRTAGVLGDAVDEGGMVAADRAEGDGEGEGQG
jgi:hypothetical protein